MWGFQGSICTQIADAGLGFQVWGSGSGFQGPRTKDVELGVDFSYGPEIIVSDFSSRKGSSSSCGSRSSSVVVVQ